MQPTEQKHLSYLKLVLADGKHDFDHVLDTRVDLFTVQHRAQGLKHCHHPAWRDFSQLLTNILWKESALMTTHVCMGDTREGIDLL